MSAAIAYSGDLQIELIYQHDDAPSIYTEFSRGGRSGLQHMGVMTDSVDGDLEQLARIGVEPIQHGRTGWGARFAYVSTDFHPGGMIELIENGSAILGAFKVIRDAAEELGRQRTPASLQLSCASAQTSRASSRSSWPG